MYLEPGSGSIQQVIMQYPVFQLLQFYLIQRGIF